MSHISEPLFWTEGFLVEFGRENDQLMIKLSDGTKRYMNFENWGDSVLITEKKLAKIGKNREIKIATWGGYDSGRWFCDIEEKDEICELDKNSRAKN